MKLGLVTVVLGALLAPQEDEKKEKPALSFLEKQPPEIKISKDRWFNSEEAVTLEGLKGKVVWLEFIGSIT